MQLVPVSMRLSRHAADVYNLDKKSRSLWKIMTTCNLCMELSDAARLQGCSFCSCPCLALLVILPRPPQKVTPGEQLQVSPLA